MDTQLKGVAIEISEEGHKYLWGKAAVATVTKHPVVS